MKLPSKKSSKIITVIVALIVIFGVGYLVAFSINNKTNLETQRNLSKSNTETPQDSGKPTDEDSQKNNPQSPDMTQKPSSPNANSPLDDPQGSDPNSGKSIVGVQITATSKNGPVYQIRSLIQTITTDGSCSLILRKGSETITRNTGIQALANNSTCQGFDIPISELSSGQWQLEIKFENNSLVGSATSTIEV